MKKVLMVLIVLLIMIIPNFRVEALVDSFYEGEYISGEYIKKFRGSSGKYQQLKVFRRKSDNSPVYCIELWEVLSSNKNINGYDNNQYSYANIDYSTWNKIMLISYYGYGYQNHTDIKWYVVTQFMIWKVTSPDTNIYFTSTLNGKKITKYESEMNEINNLISKHESVPSFNNQTHQIKYKEPYTIYDYNNVLSEFDVVNNGNLEVNKYNNQLTVKSNYMNSTQVILSKTGKNYNTNPIVYVDNSGQDVLAPGNFYPISVTVNYNIPVSSVVVNKMDKDTNSNVSLGDASLVGSRFQLFDKDNILIQEKEVTQDGKIYFNNVAYGSYYLKEVAAGEGYLLNNEVIPIEVDEALENINFCNQVIKNKVIFNKYVKNNLTGNINLERDAVFSIYDKNDNRITTFTTDENGFYQLELPYGKYIVKQEKGLKNHYFVDDFLINVIDEGETQVFDLYNEELTVNIKIINTDFDSNLPILENGASFEIKDLDSNEVFTLDTDNLGETKYLTLSSGNYEIKQIKAIYGYEINDEVFSFSIDEEEFKMKDKQDKYLEIVVSNKKLKSKLEIEKYTEYYLNDNFVKKEVDNSFYVSIYAMEDIYSKDGLKIYSKDEEVGVTEIQEENIYTPLLVYGSYYFKSPIDDVMIEIILDEIDNKKIELLDKVYEYKEVDVIDEVEEIEHDDDFLETENKIIGDEVLIDVPNTLSYKLFFSDINILFIILGLFFIRKER